MQIEDFNALPDGEAERLLLGCANVPRWGVALVGERPYDDVGSLLSAASRLAEEWTEDDVDTALADHPRIGERAAGADEAAARSAREQAGVDPADAELAARLADGNRRYEERFGRIYLVRAKGRTGPELAALLEERLGNDPATELAVTRAQLAEIALLRLSDHFEGAAA